MYILLCLRFEAILFQFVHKFFAVFLHTINAVNYTEYILVFYAHTLNLCNSSLLLSKDWMYSLTSFDTSSNSFRSGLLLIITFSMTSNTLSTILRWIKPLTLQLASNCKICVTSHFCINKPILEYACNFWKHRLYTH